MIWAALRTNDIQAVVRSLKLVDLRQANWSSGVAAASNWHSTAGDPNTAEVFVTPCLMAGPLRWASLSLTRMT
jgi:hypothetical protein